MACPNFEDLQHGAREHAARCEDCRALLEALDEVDTTLDAAFRDIAAPAGLAARARALASLEAPLRRPTWIPEILDFVGWAAVLAMAVALIPRVLPAVQQVLAR